MTEGTNTLLYYFRKDRRYHGSVLICVGVIYHHVGMN